MKPVIICGGVGTKMWPESRLASPKHFLPLIDGKSLFEINWQVLRKKFEAKDIYLQTNALQAKIAKRIVPEIVDENVFIEPEMRNQGPATGFAAASLIKAGLGDEPFMLIQADLWRKPEEKFLEMIDICDKLARENDKYITGGVKPPYAIMGIDYLIAGKKITDEKVKVFEVDKFLWRDSKEKVEEYVNSGIAMTHWNHTSMTPNNLLKLIKKYKVEWAEPLEAIINGADPVMEYAKMPKGPIEDVTQNAYNNNEALIVELPFECIDFGTWESVINYQLSVKNYELKGLEIESKNNYVRSKKFTALIGVEDLVVVETDDALLICPKNKTGKVGEIVDWLKTKEKKELL